MDENEIFALIKKAVDDSKTKIVPNLIGTANITNNTEIWQAFDISDTALTITMPTIDISKEFIGSVIFSTGSSTAGTISYPSSVLESLGDSIQIVYKGEDVISEVVNNVTVYTFTPIENKRYCFMYYWDGWYMVCEVTGYELP